MRRLTPPNERLHWLRRGGRDAAPTIHHQNNQNSMKMIWHNNPCAQFHIFILCFQPLPFFGNNFSKIVQYSFPHSQFHQTTSHAARQRWSQNTRQPVNNHILSNGWNGGDEFWGRTSCCNYKLTHIASACLCRARINFLYPPLSNKSTRCRWRRDSGMSQTSNRTGMMKVSYSGIKFAFSSAIFNSSWRNPCCLLNPRERQAITTSLFKIALRISCSQFCPASNFSLSSHASTPLFFSRVYKA